MLEDIKKLRDMTAVGIKDCKKALQEAKGDFQKALGILKEKGIQLMAKKGDRKTSQGLIDSYIHFGGNLGVLVEVNCETDFVARTDVFRKFVKDIAMHIAASVPTYVKREDVSQEVLEKEKDAEEFLKRSCLLEQPFVKNSSITIGEYLRDLIFQTGENIIIHRFVRFTLGE